MTIANAVQNGEIVEIFDQDGNKILEEEGILYGLDDLSVLIQIADNKLKRIWQEDTEFHYESDTIVNVEFEYKGVTIKGFSIFSKKDYYGATMTSPVNGIKTLDSYHIPGIAHWGNDEVSIKHKTIESLKKAYDEYLLLLSKKEVIAHIVNVPFPLRERLEGKFGPKTELVSLLAFIKNKKNEISEGDFNTFTFRLEREIERYDKIIENDYRVSFYEEKFSVIKNFNEIAQMIANNQEE